MMARLRDYRNPMILLFGSVIGKVKIGLFQNFRSLEVSVGELRAGRRNRSDPIPILWVLVMVLSPIKAPSFVFVACSGRTLFSHT